MTKKELEQAILELICRIYCKKYIGRLKVEDIFSSFPYEVKHIGYTLKMDLNKDEAPYVLSKEGDEKDFLEFIEKELRNASLVSTDYFTAIQLYNNYDEYKKKL